MKFLNVEIPVKNLPELDQGFVPEARVAGGKAVFLVLRNRRIWFSTPVTDCAIIWLTDGR